MAFSTGSAGLHGVTAGRHRIPQGEFQAQPGNRQDQRDDPLAMILTSRLILTNRNQNICYMNSVVQVCHWLLQLRPTRVAFMGTGQVFFDALKKHHSHNPKNLLKDAHWRAMIVGWRDHHRQHDAAEFFSYLRQTHNFGLFQGQWDARRIYQGLLQVRDTGLCTQPVVLSLPRTPPGLSVNIQVQSLLDYWSGAQSSVHAFSAPPLVLTLQIERFRNNDGAISKRRDPIDVDRELVIPTFAGEGMQVRVAHYELVATISHHGAHPKTGHYTAHLFEGSHIWSCDDNRCAKYVSAVSRSHACDCYLLLYAQCNSSPDVVTL